MFIYKECAQKRAPKSLIWLFDYKFTQSYGQCELCNKVAGCADIESACLEKERRPDETRTHR